MPVSSYTELARTFENELGGSPKAVRTWVVTLTNDTLENNPATTAEIIAALNISNYGTIHPEYTNNPWFGLRKATFTERYEDSPYHVQVVAEYGVVSANELVNPTARAADWSFESKPSQVPALYYWDGTTRRPLTNSAYDYYEGLTTEELIVVAKVSKNYTDFDAANGPQDLIKATNKINSGDYLGCASHTWKVAGVSTQYVTEIYNNVSHQYWRTTSELQFRQSTWKLFLPDVGWNYLDGAQKRRAMVFDFDNGEWVASPNPVALNGSGGLALGTWPYIWDRRVNEEVNFSPLFGTPPTV
jgi:hypothetical protein